MSEANVIEDHRSLSVCKYLDKDVAELHNDTVLNDDMLFTTIQLTKEIHNDERCIIACSFCNDRLGQQIHIFDGLNDELIKSRVLHKKESSKMLTAFDVFLISCSTSGNIVIIDARTGSIAKKVKFREFDVEDICVHGDSTHSEILQILMTKSDDEDNKIYILDIKTEEIQFVLQGHQAYINTLQIAEQSVPVKDSLIISTSDDMTCRTWLMSTGKQKNVFEHKSIVTCAHYYPNGTLITGCQNGGVYIWKEHTVELKQSYEDYASPVMCIESYEAADMLLIIGYEDGSIRVWDASSKDCLAALFGHKDRIRSLCPISLKNPKIISCSNDGAVKMWNLDKLINDYFTSSLFSAGKKRNNKAAYRVDKGNTVENISVSPAAALPSIDTSLPLGSPGGSRPSTTSKRGAKGASNLDRPTSSSSQRASTFKSNNTDDEVQVKDSDMEDQQPIPPSVTPPTKKSNNRSNALVGQNTDIASSSKSKKSQEEINKVNTSEATNNTESLDDKVKQIIADAKGKTDAIDETLSEQTTMNLKVEIDANTNTISAPISATTSQDKSPSKERNKSFLRHAVNIVGAVNKFSFTSKSKKKEDNNNATSVNTNRMSTPPVVSIPRSTVENNDEAANMNIEVLTEKSKKENKVKKVDNVVESVEKMKKDNKDTAYGKNSIPTAPIEVKEECLDKSFPPDIAKLHPTLPPLSPVIKSQFRDSSVAQSRLLEGPAVRYLDFREQSTDSDKSVVPLSPEKKEIVDSLVQVNESIKLMQSRNGQKYYAEEENDYVVSHRRDDDDARDYSYTNSSPPSKNIQKSTRNVHRRDGKDGSGRNGVRKNKGNAAKLSWEIDDPDLYTLSDSD